MEAECKLLGPVLEGEDCVTKNGVDDLDEREGSFDGRSGRGRFMETVLEPTTRSDFESSEIGVPAIVVATPFALSVEPSISMNPEGFEDIVWPSTVAIGAAASCGSNEVGITIVLEPTSTAPFS